MAEILNEKREELHWRAPGFFGPLLNAITSGLRQIRVRRKIRTLHLQETLALGDKRFLAVIDWHGETLLLGVTSHSITLLQPQSDVEVRKFSWEKERIA